MQTTLTNRLGLHPVRTFARSAGATLPGRIALGLAATAFIALAAHVAFPLWFTPVPLTLQPLAVLLVGLAFGPIGGFLTLLAYLAEGACGLPVFAPSGLGGLAVLHGFTAGYLLAYPLVAAIAGGLSRALGRRFSLFAAALIACIAATVLLFLAGAGWFMALTHFSLRAVWLETVAPFLPGEAIKILAAAGIYSTLRRSHHNDPPASRI
ncbi:MAG TPA: biotin transporter BioY [Acidobacteriaceae bacterium]|jgi:biotin transport system substrate-specific component|nr:biotin transporter BioY [Acidobacteriaceae bacterium]